MKAAGITAEYNPLHNGHVYHIGKTRELTGCDAVVVALSGDFIQRGAPAAADKWTRTRHALECGADLVTEIPVLHCLGNAGQYASAGVSILENAGVSSISFGSESGGSDILRRTAEFLRANRHEMEELIALHAKKGMSYPAARAEAFRMLGGDAEGLAAISSPNDILAVEYMLAMKSASALPVRRSGAGYSDSADERHKFQSASGIRQLMTEGEDVSGYVPGCVAGSLPDAETLRRREERLFDLIRYAVMSVSAESIDDCPSGGEGLGNLIKAEAMKAASLDDLIMRVKSKRYTYTRIARLLMQVLLGISRAEYYAYGASGDAACPAPGYIRVLGFTDAGRELLSGLRKSGSCPVPVITNINKERHLLTDEAQKMLSLDVHAADVYNLICGREEEGGSDHIHRPVYL